MCISGLTWFSEKCLQFVLLWYLDTYLTSFLSESNFSFTVKTGLYIYNIQTGLDKKHYSFLEIAGSEEMIIEMCK